MNFRRDCGWVAGCGVDAKMMADSGSKEGMIHYLIKELGNLKAAVLCKVEAGRQP
jgi:hypothetical protein